LVESESPFLTISFNFAPEQLGGWSEALDLISFGESSLEVSEELSHLFREDGVVDLHHQNVDELLDKDREHSRVDKRLGEAERDKPERQEGVLGL